MKNKDTKELLLDAAKELLQDTMKPEGITARQIAAKAEVNLALINYYYGSKDALVNEAIGQILQNAASLWQVPAEPTDLNHCLQNKEHENTQVSEAARPKERLKQMLVHLSDSALKYYHYTKISIRYEILENEITIPYYILPLIKDYYGNEKNESELKLIAFQLISTLQLIFLKSGPFIKYTGENIWDKKTRDQMIRAQVDLLLHGGKEGAFDEPSPK